MFPAILFSIGLTLAAPSSLPITKKICNPPSYQEYLDKFAHGRPTSDGFIGYNLLCIDIAKNEKEYEVIINCTI